MGGEAHQVELFAAALDIVIDGFDLSVFEELVFAGGDVYLDKVLIHNPSGSEIHVADL